MSVVEPSRAPVPPPRGRRAAWFVAALALAALVWSGAWLLASRRAAAGLDEWLRAEAASGRQWTCPERTVEGYPLALRVTCRQPTFHGEVAGRIATGSADALRAGVTLAEPRTVMVDLAGPLYLRAEDGEFDLVVSWSTLGLTLGPLPDPVREGSLDATRLAVTLRAQTADGINMRADHLTGRAEPATAPGMAAGDEAFAFSGSGVSFPTLDGFMGTDALMQAEGRGVLVHADRLSAPTVVRLEGWRRNGGRLDVAAIKVSKGAFVGEASGMLGLDEGHRVAGRLDTSLQGFGPMAERFGIPIAGVKLGGLLSSLLGGKRPVDQRPASPDTVRLPVSLTDGHISVGPFQTPLTIPPFY